MSKIPLEAIKAAQNSLRHDYVHADNKTVARALEAADGARAQGAEVAVKPLEWVRMYDEETYHAQSIVGRWARWEGHYLPPDGYGGVACPDPIAAAQADYEQRIRSALTIPPAPQPTDREKVLEEAAKLVESMFDDDGFRIPSADKIALAIRALSGGEA